MDDHTRVFWVDLLRDKSEATLTFTNFYSMIKTQFNDNVQILQTDNGTKYFNSILEQFLTSNGLIHQSSCISTPQNVIFERKNRHLLEVAQSL